MPNTVEPGPEKAEGATPLQRAYRQIVSFSRMANEIVQEDDLNVACRLFLEAVREHSGYGRAVLTLLDESGRDTQWFFTGLSDDEIDHFHRHKITPAQRASALHERHRVGGSFRVPATEEIQHGGLPAPLAAGRGAPPPAGAGDLLFIPLYGARGALAGTLMLAGPLDAQALGDESLSALELFASQMAHAVEKKRFDQAVKTMQARLRAAHDQLMQSEKMSAIGQLISGVTHELNNPLAGIMGFAQLLMSAEVNPKTRKNLERIYSEAVRSQKIVQNLLSFSRRHKPEKSYRSLNAAIDSVLELRAYQLQVDDVEIVRAYDADLPKTMLDFHQLQQVILNVVNNAHQAMMDTTERPRRLTITTARDGGALRATFADTGTGIAAERLGSIFDPFFTTKSEGKGTGLGLSLSRSIIKEHKGTMRAESKLGLGTTIVIELPLLEEETAPGPAATKPAAAPAPGMSVLVVDDEDILVELLGEFLRASGHKVDEARNGAQALEMALARDYDVILTDLKMPGLDGQGFYERLVKAKPAMRRRFIFSTGDLVNPKVQTFFQSTGCRYLSKPFKLEAVLALLDDLAREGAGRRRTA